MVLDEDKQRTSSSVAGDSALVAGMRPKKPKHKKIPQRGLGVAQLEKIRMEEQQKKSAAASSSSSSDPLPHSFGLPQQQYIPFTTNDGIIRPPPPPPPPPAPPIMLRPPPPPPSPTAVFRGSVSASSATTTSDFLVSPSQVLETTSNDEQDILPMLWNANALETEVLAKRFGFHLPPRSDFSNSLTQRKQQQPPPIAFASNHKLTPSLSSGFNLRMEPPSNQTNSNSYDLLSCWREQERMVGMKRPWPFHHDGMASYPCKAPSLLSSRPKAEDSSPPAFGTGLVRPDSQSTDFRGSTSSSFVDLTSSDLHLDQSNKQNGGASDGSFLSLGSHSVKSTHNPPFHQNDHSDFSIRLHQKSSGNNGSSSHGRPFYSFLPIGPSSSETTSNETREAAADDIDLNLKL